MIFLLLRAGVKHEEGRIETHYLTDHHKLCFAHNPFLEKCSQKTSEKDKSEKIKFTLETPDGHWTQRDSMAETELGMIIWVKKTFVFHTKTGIKTKWIMDVYYLINRIFRRIEVCKIRVHAMQSRYTSCLSTYVITNQYPVRPIGFDYYKPMPLVCTKRCYMLRVRCMITAG